MNLTAWRICKQKHCQNAFNGEGARLFGGRWNSPGTAVVYVAGSQSLAALEMLVHLNASDLLGKYVLIPVEFADTLVEEIEVLPRNWKAYPAPSEARDIGDRWVQQAAAAVLRVPSTLVPAENNFLLNPRHADFPKLKIGQPVEFGFDVRLRKPTKP